MRKMPASIALKPRRFLMTSKESRVPVRLRLVINEIFFRFSSINSCGKTSVWSLGILNHVAIAVPDLKKSVHFYRDILQASVSEPQVSSTSFSD